MNAGQQLRMSLHGVAAINIDGTSMHALMGIPIEFDKIVCPNQSGFKKARGIINNLEGDCNANHDMSLSNTNKRHFMHI